MKKYGWYKCDKVGDLKELLNRSAEKFASRDAFRIKTPEGGILGISYKKLSRDVEAFGSALLHLGLFGSHIAVIGENSYEWVVTYLAAVNSGCVIVPIDKELSEAVIANIIDHSDSRAIVYSETFKHIIENLQSKVPELRLCIGMHEDTDHGSFRSFQNLLTLGNSFIERGASAYKNIRIDPEKTAVIIYTSGTTGKSKGVMLSHKNLASVIVGAMQALRTERVTMSVLPIHHTYECTCGILTALYAGVTVCFCDSLKYVPENLALFKPSMLVLVPLFLETMYKKIWDRARKFGMEKVMKRAIKLSNALLKLHIDLRPLFFRLVRLAFGGRLKLIVCGGAPLRAELVKGFNELGILVLNGYGITECSPLVAANRNKYYSEDSVGVVVPCCEVRIADPDENGEGEILVRGDNVMSGYYKNEEATEQAFSDGWFKTGDIGRFDQKGFLHVTGRLKNTIILNNGKNVQPEELEDHFKGKLPYIKEVVVFPEEKEEGEETTICAAFVFDKEYLEENGIEEPEELLKSNFLDANRMLPAYKQIGKYTFQYDEFEKTTTKKIKRFKIRKENQHA